MRTANLALTACVLLALSRNAHASLDLTLTNTTPSGPNTLFSYEVSIATNDVIRVGDFFRIYDFGGYVPGSIVAPIGWAATVQFSTPTPPPNVILTYGDDPTIPNLIFTYNGIAPISGPTTISGFNALTTSFAGKFTLKDFVARVGTTSGGNADSIGANAVAPAAPPVPEPGSITLFLGVGTVGAAFLRRRRNLRKAL